MEQQSTYELEAEIAWARYMVTAPNPLPILIAAFLVIGLITALLV